MTRSLIFFILYFWSTLSVSGQSLNVPVKIISVDSGWANNSVNAVVFRKNSLVTWKDTQFTAFYNRAKYVMLGKRKLGSDDWTIVQTPYQGNASDAHNTISIMVDGEGYLHIAWDHHNNPLRYARGVAPASLELTDKIVMTGLNDQRVSYPEFFRLNNGNLLFFYRNGESGKGNLVINHYHLSDKKWSTLQDNLIDGEGQRNAYWQAYTDEKGTIHISWVWRESPDVASNHDLCYARSEDEGKTWEKSTGEKYQLPITVATAEYAYKIPQRSELINQTSMCADEKGNPFIATYWRDSNSSVPQYHIVYKHKTKWIVVPLNFRNTAFTLSGIGTKRIPIARPQIMVKGKGKRASVLLIFRDSERGDKASAVSIRKIRKAKWQVTDLTTNSLGSWEPTYDTELWKERGILNLFIQRVEQIDGEGLADISARIIQVLEWKP